MHDSPNFKKSVHPKDGPPTTEATVCLEKTTPPPTKATNVGTEKAIPPPAQSQLTPPLIFKNTLTKNRPHVAMESDDEGEGPDDDVFVDVDSPIPNINMKGLVLCDSCTVGKTSSGGGGAATSPETTDARDALPRVGNDGPQFGSWMRAKIGIRTELGGSGFCWSAACWRVSGCCSGGTGVAGDEGGDDSIACSSTACSRGRTGCCSAVTRVSGCCSGGTGVAGDEEERTQSFWSSSKPTSGTGAANSGGRATGEIKWEVRPGGMLVQKRESNTNNEEGVITIRISTVSKWHHISIQPTSTFGELKVLLSLLTNLGTKEQRLLFKGKEREDDEHLHMVGVKDKDKVLMLEDPAIKERKLRGLARPEFIGPHNYRIITAN
ncbi:Ubiquitin-like superfamily protein [Striga hermonthica]|uniref:Ubiquitin-like superfamily protein n=1 Tax=Striga hermonthica TaxID=68872 RepID=A0A9N7N6Z0_STRHE|nr:Ubiquitin-like superfamily protein [Striga hermonthica]